MTKIKPCCNYDTLHLMYNGEPSFTCKNCLNREPVDKGINKFTFPEGKVNCKNFNIKKRTIIRKS